jgi:hypothetical protein
MIPTRQQIREQLEKGKDLPALSAWLEEIDCPTQKTIAGQVVNPRQQIIDDLPSYNA